MRGIMPIHESNKLLWKRNWEDKGLRGQNTDMQRQTNEHHEPQNVDSSFSKNIRQQRVSDTMPKEFHTPRLNTKGITATQPPAGVNAVHQPPLRKHSQPMPPVFIRLSLPRTSSDPVNAQQNTRPPQRRKSEPLHKSTHISRTLDVHIAHMTTSSAPHLQGNTAGWIPDASPEYKTALDEFCNENGREVSQYIIGFNEPSTEIMDSASVIFNQKDDFQSTDTCQESVMKCKAWLEGLPEKFSGLNQMSISLAAGQDEFLS